MRSRHHSVCSLPMRNWNRIGTHDGEGFDVFVAYLWGIETTATYPVETYGTCVCSLPMRNWNQIAGSNPLLTERVCSLPMRNWNELRLGKSFSMAVVCSLPMRNWNSKFGNNRSQFIKFVAYLWGIETLNLVTTGVNSSMFVAYLWGIETCDSPDSNITRIAGFVAYLWGIETKVLPQNPSSLQSL